MNATESTSAPLLADSPFNTEVRIAFRGGAVMLAGSVLWGLLLQRRYDPFFNLCFIWLPAAWLVFPLGALLGCFLPRWVATRGLVSATGIGVLVGAVSGLALATGFWLCATHHDLIGLVANRGSGGYASYSYSVQLELREKAWRALAVVAPVTAVWVTAWTIWTNRSSRFAPCPRRHENSTPGVSLQLDHHVFRLVGWVAAGFAIFATAALVFTSLTARGVHVPVASFLVVGPAAAGLVVLGPWLGPLINPGGGSTAAWQITAVALPVLLGGLAPFALRGRSMRPGTAAVAWCGFITALLFWIAAGAISLGWSLG